MTTPDARLAHARARLGDRWPTDALRRAERYRELRAEAMAEARDAGMTVQEVADALGLHKSAVEQWVQRYGVFSERGSRGTRSETDASTL